MAKGFTLSVYPWTYLAKYKPEDGWIEEYQEKPHKSLLEETSLDGDVLGEMLQSRNSFQELPLVNYTTQYGFGCFEGLKAFPQRDGSLKLFRPERTPKGLLNPW